MFMFTARYRGQVQSILVHKEMKVPEFLDALTYSLGLPEGGQIVGFQDRNGLIITPSFVCHNSSELRNETYDVLLKNAPSVSQNQSNLFSTGVINNNAVSDQQQHQQHSGIFNSHIGNAARLGGVGILPQQNIIPPSQSNERSPINNNNVGSYIEQLNGAGSQEEEIINFVRNLPTDPLLTENVKSKIIAKVRQRDSGILGAYHLYLVDGDSEGFKARIIHRALTPPAMSSGNMTVGDLYCSSATTAPLNWTASRTSTAGGGFRPQTRENSRLRNLNLQTSLLSGQFPQQQQQNIFGGASQQHISTSQDRYLPVILELETKGLLNDEQTASLLKTLVLEENFEVFRVINSYLAKAISDRELSFRLIRLAQQLSTYLERPQSPLPRKKNQLLQFVNSLARYHFNNDPDDVQLLNKLIQEENEFILSCFDVFESDKDHDNLIDSLRRILEKSKQMGLHRSSMTASSFYNNNPWQRQGGIGSSFNPSPINNGNQSQLYPSANTFIGGVQQPVGHSQSQTSLRYQQPYISKWGDQSSLSHNQTLLQAMAGQPHFANQSQIPQRSSERPHGAVGSRRGNGNQTQSIRSSNLGGGSLNQSSGQQQVNNNLPGGVPQHFQNTTVHNVALIPNYFSSGEEEAAASQQLRQSRFNNLPLSLGNTQVKPQRQNYINDDDGQGEDFSGQSQHNKDDENEQQIDQISRVDSHKQSRQARGNQKYASRGAAAYNTQNHQHQQNPISTESDVIEIPNRHGNQRSKAQPSAQGTNQKSHHHRDAGYSQKTSTNKKSKYSSYHQKDTTGKKSHKKHHHYSEDEEELSEDDRHRHSKSKQRKHQHSSKRKKSAKKHHKKSTSSDSSSDSRYSDSSRSSSASSSSSNSSDSSRSNSSNDRKNYHSSKRRSPAKAKPLTNAQLSKLFKREQLQEYISSPKYAMLLHLIFDVRDNSLSKLLSDFYQQDTDLDFFLTYVRARTDDLFNQLMLNHKFSLEEQQKTELLINELCTQEDLTKEAMKIGKLFEKFSQKLWKNNIEKGKSSTQKEGKKDMDKLIAKIRKIVAKGIVKHKVPQSSTQNSERIIRGTSGKEYAHDQVNSNALRRQQQQTYDRTNNLVSSYRGQNQPQQFDQKMLDTNYSMIYYGEFLTKSDEEGVLVRMLYEQKNTEFLKLLSEYLVPADYDRLKQGIYALIQQHPDYSKYVKPPPPAIKPSPKLPPSNLLEAIDYLEYDGSLTAQDATNLRTLNASGEKKLKIIFGAYLAEKDFDDLADSLLMICGHKRGERKRRLQVAKENREQQMVQQINQQTAGARPPRSQASSSVRSNGNRRVNPPNVQEYQARQTYNQTASSGVAGQGMGKISLGFGGTPQVNNNGSSIIQPYEVPSAGTNGSNQNNDRKYSSSGPVSAAPITYKNVVNDNRKHSSENEPNHSSDDVNLEINDNPNESGTDTTNEDEIISIIEFQHKILRKYTLSGLIRYYDASFFHDMVTKRDYKMISIFEVFAVNRNEEDFLENLFIFKELVNEEQLIEQRQKEMLQLAQEEESNFPNIKVLNQVRDKITPEQYQWVKAQLMSEAPHKMLLGSIECWKLQKDDSDLIDSFQRLYKRCNPQ